MDNKEIIERLEGLDSETSNIRDRLALVYAITTIERVEKVLSEQRFKNHEITFILRSEEFP